MIKKQKLLSLFLLTSVLLFSCNKEDLNQNESSADAATETQVRYTDNPTNNFEMICSGQCADRGFYYTVWEDYTNGNIFYRYSPIEYIWVNQTDHNNPSSIPEAYTYYDMIPAATIPNGGAPVLDYHGNVIVGDRYRYKIVPGHNVFFGAPWISTTFETNVIVNTIVDPCSVSNAVFYLNNSSNKPAGGTVSNYCVSGGLSNDDGVVAEPSGSDPFKPIVLTNIYGKLCNETLPGFCFDDPNGVQPSHPVDPIVGPAVFSYHDDNTIRVDFYRDVVDEVIDITSSNNIISPKLLDHCRLPEEAVITPNSYDVLGRGTTSDFGHVLIEIEY